MAEAYPKKRKNRRLFWDASDRQGLECCLLLAMLPV